MIVLSIVCFVLLTLVYLFVFGYLFAYFCHEKDRKFGNSILSKLVVVVGMLLSWIQPLLLMLDVAHSRNHSPLFSDWTLLFQINYCLVLLFLLLLLPVSLFCYRSDPDDSPSLRFKDVFCSSLMMMAFVGVVLGVSYALSSESSIPINTQVKGTTLFSSGTTLSSNVADENGQPKILSLPV